MYFVVSVKFMIHASKDSEKVVPSDKVDVLHAQHPALADAISVLTQGSASPGIAFRQEQDFCINTLSGKKLGGKAGDYVLVFKAPQGTEVDAELIKSLITSGIPSKEYEVSIIDAVILHFSYSHTPISDQVIGREGLVFGERHLVYKAAGLRQMAYIPAENQTELGSLESIQAGDTQRIKPHQLVLLDIAGNPYPKNSDQFVEQFKPDPADSRSENLFQRVREELIPKIPSK